MAGLVKFKLLHGINKVRAMNTPVEFPLLKLPNELIILVIEHVESKSALKLLCRTCRKLQLLTEPILYYSALIRTGAKTEGIVNAITQTRRGRDRVAALTKIDIPCAPRKDHNFPDMALLLEEAVNLRELMIESPECNTSHFEAEEQWEHMADHLFRPFRNALSTTANRRPLQNLKNLVLHLNGCDSPYWTLDRRTLSMFLLPSLTHLKISCVNIPPEISGEAGQKGSSSLKHLELEESNVTVEGLKFILSLPRALETLYLGENCHNIRHFGDEIDPAANHLFTSETAATLEALKQQSRTLKKLVYTTTDIYYQHRERRRTRANNPPVNAGFVDFFSLESVTLVGHCPNFERAVMSSRSPPSLKELKFKSENVFRMEQSDDPRETFSMIPFLRAPSPHIPEGLMKLDVVYHNPPLSIQNLEDSLRAFIETAAAATEKVGIKMRVLSEDRTNYFPPYLYGEPIPEEEVVYEAKQFSANFASPSSSTGSLWSPVED